MTFRPTCPRCSYLCDPLSIVCCECGTRLTMTADQLRGMREAIRVVRMTAPQASDMLPTDDRGSASTADGGSDRGRARAVGRRATGVVGALGTRTAALPGEPGGSANAT